MNRWWEDDERLAEWCRSGIARNPDTIELCALRGAGLSEDEILRHVATTVRVLIREALAAAAEESERWEMKEADTFEERWGGIDPGGSDFTIEHYDESGRRIEPPELFKMWERRQ